MKITLLEKIASRFGFVRKNWSNDWLKAIEYNRMQQGNKIVEPYAQHQDVYKAIKAISDNVGQADFEFYKGETKVRNPDLERLFRNPNPLMSRSQLWEATAIFLSLKGRCFWYLNKSIGQVAGTGRTIPAEIWVYNPDHFHEKRDQNGNLLYWSYRGSEPIDPQNLIYFKYFNPYDPILGLSPYSPIQKTVDLDYQSMIYNSKFFENGATPGYVLSTDQSLSDEQFNRLKSQWDSEHKGVNQAHKMALLEGGLKPVSTGESHREMEFTAQRELNREDIMGIWRVPKALFSITDDLNYATFQGQKKMFWTDTIIPILRYLEEELNAHFFERYSLGITGKFEFSNVLSLQDSLDDKLTRAEKLFNMGVPFNTIDKELNLGIGDIEGGDIGYLPFALQPIAQKTETPEPIKPDPVIPQQDPQQKPEEAPTPKSIKKALDRAEVAKLFVSVQDKIEKRFESTIKSYLFEQRGLVLEQIGEGKSLKIAASIQIDWSHQDQQLIKATGPLITESVKSGVKFAASMLGDALDFNLINPLVSSLIQDRFSKIKEINQTIKGQLQDQLNESLTAGETTAEIADRVRSVYNTAGNRAKVIARTEVTGAMNSGTFASFKQAGISKKQWATSHDERVRDSHQEVDGEITGINNIFSNGVDFPGGHGDPSEIINCRCTMVPVIED